MGVTQKIINFNTIDLNVQEIGDIIYENSHDIVTERLKKNDVKIWNIFEVFFMKNEGKDDEEIFHQNMTTAHTGKHRIPIPKMLNVIRMAMEWSWRRIGRPLSTLQ